MILNDLRIITLLDWLENDCLLNVENCESASNDASFRRYFRVTIEGKTFIAMDAPPDKEDIAPFMRIANLFKQANVNTPTLLQHNTLDGFLLLEDFGSQWLLDELNDENAAELYGVALRGLLPLHTHETLLNADLPCYDETLLRREMALFEEWFVEQLLDSELPPDLWENVQQVLIQSALEQPVVCVHRDYHSRNLMVLPTGELGVLDFQDAVLGALTYDIVSLLRDCYIDWSDDQIEMWLRNYFEQLKTAKVVDCDFVQFKRWFDLMGMQRHLKVCGIFARLHLRDDKSEYLKSIPRTLNYIIKVCGAYPELSEFQTFLAQQILLAWQRSKFQN
ncbi:MAG: phosphotransferase [Methylococcales bacterium]|nr:phosphotransferase [Methylococcales bacterium]